VPVVEADVALDRVVDETVFMAPIDDLSHVCI